MIEPTMFVRYGEVFRFHAGHVILGQQQLASNMANPGRVDVLGAASSVRTSAVLTSSANELELLRVEPVIVNRSVEPAQGPTLLLLAPS